MTRLLAPAILALALATPAAAEPRALANFTGISASAGVQVEVSVGAFSVDVSGPGASGIETRVVNGELRVHPRRQFGWGNRRQALVRVTMPRIESLDASSSARISATGVRSGDLSLGASSGAGVTVAGVCTSLDADISSGARVNAAALQCENGEVNASSGARADVNVTGALSVDASSGADIYASGSPQIDDVSLSSGASLHRS